MSLQVWLPLNGSMENKGLKNVNITINGSTSSIFTTAKTGQGLSCNGSTFWNITGVTLGAEASIACWTKTTVNGKMSWTLVSSISDRMNLWESNIYTLNTGDSNNNPFQDSSGNTIAVLHDGNWHHFVVTFGSSIAKLYIDGVYRGTAKTFKSPATTSANTVRLGGGYGNGHTYDWNGGLCDFRIYNHCLSESEARKVSQGLILHYPLDRRGLGQENLVKSTYIMPVHSSNLIGFRASGGTVSHIDYSNLPIGTGVIRMTNTGTASASVGMAEDSITGFITGETYSQSCWARASTNVTNFVLQPIWKSSSQTTGKGGKTFTIGTNWTYVKLEGVVLEGEQASSYSTGYVYGTVPANGWIEVCGMKVEHGSKATPWSPHSTELIIDNNIYDVSGFDNNGEWYRYDTNGEIEYTTDTPRYWVSTYINSENNTTNTASGTVYLYGHCGLTTPNQMTIAFWCKPIAGYNSTTTQGQFCTTTYAYGDASVGSDYQGSAMNHRDGTVDMNDSASTTQVRPTITFTANEWHHYVFTYDGQNGKSYRDGVLQNTKSFADAKTLDSFIGVVIGFSKAGGVWRSNKSYYSDFRLYCTALSANDIKELYEYNI